MGWRGGRKLGIFFRGGSFFLSNTLDRTLPKQRQQQTTKTSTTPNKQTWICSKQSTVKSEAKLCLQYLLINISDTDFDGGYENVISEYWKVTRRWTVPRNLTPMYWISFMRRGLENNNFYKKWMSSSARLPPRNFADFEWQFLLEYYTQRGQKFYLLLNLISSFNGCRRFVSSAWCILWKVVC